MQDSNRLNTKIDLKNNVTLAGDEIYPFVLARMKYFQNMRVSHEYLKEIMDVAVCFQNPNAVWNFAASRVTEAYKMAKQHFCPLDVLIRWKKENEKTADFLNHTLSKFFQVNNEKFTMSSDHTEMLDEMANCPMLNCWTYESEMLMIFDDFFTWWEKETEIFKQWELMFDLIHKLNNDCMKPPFVTHKFWDEIQLFKKMDKKRKTLSHKDVEQILGKKLTQDDLQMLVYNCVKSKINEKTQKLLLENVNACDFFKFDVCK